MSKFLLEQLESKFEELEIKETLEEDELEEAQIELEEDDDFVNEIVRRVAKRLLKK